MKSAVIGLGFGDEGKGMFVDYLASQNTNSVVARFSGGHQVGHMVNTGEVRHVFSNFGSGTLRGVPTYWGKDCTVDPVGLMKEFVELGRKKITPKLFVDALCPITTPFDKYANIQWEEKASHGTVGVGFGKTIEREENFYSLKFIDIMYPTIFSEKLGRIEDYYGFEVDTYELKQFLDDVRRLRELINNNSYIVIVKNQKEAKEILGDNIIYEGSQGLMLDPHIGFFPNVTRSNLIPKDDEIDNYYFITRAYGTRHGNGYLPNEDFNFKIKVNPEEVNVDTGIQGSFRRAILDVSLLEYSYNRFLAEHKSDNKKHMLVITCLDHLDIYSFTSSRHGLIYSFDNKEDFCKTISKTLKIPFVFMVDGDTIDHVKYVDFSLTQKNKNGIIIL